MMKFSVSYPLVLQGQPQGCILSHFYKPLRALSLSRIFVNFSLKLTYLAIVVYPTIVACICNPATLEAKFWKSVGSMPVKGNSSLIGGWIV